MKHHRLLLLLIFCIVSWRSSAQDFAFSQYHLTPFINNPARVVLNNEMQFSLHYRYQNIASGNSYTTPMISASYPLMKKGLENKTFGGLGLSVIMDNQADFLKTTGGLFAFNKHFQIKKSILSLGVQGGYFQKRIDLGNVITDNQIASGILDENLTSNEDFENLQVSYPIFGGGIMWYGLDNQNLTKYFVGFSANILNQPDVSFFSSNTNASIKLPRNFTLTAGLRLFDKNRISLMPNFRWIKRLGANHLNIGSWLHYQLLGSQNLLKQGQISLGAWYHSNKTAVFSMEIQQPKYFAALSFDVGASNQATEWMGNPTWEMTLGFKIARKSKVPKKKEEIIPDKIVPYTLQESDTLITQKGDSLYQNIKQTFIFKNRKDSTVIKRLDAILKDDYVGKLKIDTLKTNTKVVIDTVRFNYGSDELDEDSKAILVNLVDILKKFPNLEVVLVGHASNEGKEEENFKLSEERALKIKKYLEQKEIDTKRITARGMGEYEPIDSNDTEEGKRRNRRVEIILVENDD